MKKKRRLDFSLGDIVGSLESMNLLCEGDASIWSQTYIQFLKFPKIRFPAIP